MPPRKRRVKRARADSDLTEEQMQRVAEACAELDVKVKSDLKSMEEKLNLHISKIESFYRSAEMTLSKNVREMTVSEYMSKRQGGSLDTEQNPMQTLSDSICEKFAYIAQKHGSAKKLQASSKKKSAAPANYRNGLSSSIGKTLIDSQRRSGTKKGRKPLHSDSSVVCGKSNSRPLKDEVFASPLKMRKRPNCQVITPKFDVSRPVLASRCRAPRPGETTVSLSGSPLQNPPSTASSKDCVITIGGKELDFSNARIDKKEKLKLRSLHQKIAQLISKN